MFQRSMLCIKKYKKKGNGEKKEGKKMEKLRKRQKMKNNAYIVF